MDDSKNVGKQRKEAGFDQGFGEGIELTCGGGLNFGGIRDLKIGKGLTVCQRFSNID